MHSKLKDTQRILGNAESTNRIGNIATTSYPCVRTTGHPQVSCKESADVNTGQSGGRGEYQKLFTEEFPNTASSSCKIRAFVKIKNAGVLQINTIKRDERMTCKRDDEDVMTCNIVTCNISDVSHVRLISSDLTPLFMSPQTLAAADITHKVIHDPSLCAEDFYVKLFKVN